MKAWRICYHLQVTFPITTLSQKLLLREEKGNYKSLIIDLTEIENISLLDGDSIEIPYVKPILIKQES